MLDKINDFAYIADYTKINIRDKHEITYIEVMLTDYRFDLLMFNHYGYNFDKTYGLDSELIMFLIYVFNNFNDLLSTKILIKLPNIYELLERLVIDENDKIPGVYINSEIVLSDKSKIIDYINNELKLRLKQTQKYNKKTGKITF